ncbi:MAG: BsuPI-related putative proteinase inhibitor [Thermodesulfobacteriota bacterium]
MTRWLLISVTLVLVAGLMLAPPSYLLAQSSPPGKATAAPAAPGAKQANYLKLELDLESEVLKVPKPPPGVPDPRQNYALALKVTNLYKHPWEGVCPTSQLYDFFIEKNGKEIWRWSKDRVFLQVITLVVIYAADPKVYRVTWSFSPEEIKSAGTYRARAIFIASKQEVFKDFQVRFGK